MHLARVILAAVLAGLPALGASAQLLVLNKGDATLAFIDPASGKTTVIASTGEGPHEVEVSSDGRLAFVSNYGGRTPGNTLSVIDIAAHEELKHVDLGELRSSPAGILVTPDGATAYVAVTGSDRVAVVDLKTPEHREDDRHRPWAGWDGVGALSVPHVLPGRKP